MCARVTHPAQPPSGFCPSGLCSAGGVRQAPQVALSRAGRRVPIGWMYVHTPACLSSAWLSVSLSVCLFGSIELVRPSFHFSGRSCALTGVLCSVWCVCLALLSFASD